MVDMTDLLLLAPPLDRGHTAGRFDAEGQRMLADRCYPVISATRDGVTNETDGSFCFAGRKTVRTPLPSQRPAIATASSSPSAAPNGWTTHSSEVPFNAAGPPNSRHMVEAPP